MTAFSALALRPIAFLSDAELLTWGNDSIDVLTKFYGEEQTHTYKDPVTKEIHTYTSPPKIEAAKVKEEWQQLKAVVKQQQYPKDCMNTLYRIITECHPGQFQQIIYLASLALTHPIHTADCERAFSEQNRMVTPSRNRLSSEHCCQLMTIMINGPDLISKKIVEGEKNELKMFEGFQLEETIEKWRNTKLRAIFSKNLST